MEGTGPLDAAGFESWNALWQGALAAHNRDLRLVTSRDGETIVWKIES